MSGNSAEDTFFGNRNSTSFSNSDESEADKIQLLHSIVQEALQLIFNVEGEEIHFNEYKDLSLTRENPDYIKRLHALLVEKVSKKVDSSLEQQNKNLDLQARFSELQELCKKNTSEEIAWRPSHNVDADIRSIVMEEKIKFRDQLKSMVSLKENKVAELKNKILNSRSRKETMRTRLGVLTAKLYNIADEIQTMNDIIE